MLIAMPQLKPVEDWRDSVPGIVALGRKLKDAREKMSRPDFEMYAVRETGLVDISASHKIITIAHNPILSDPVNASKLPAAWVKLYNLGRLPDDELLKFIADGRAISLTKTKMREILYGNKGADLRRRAFKSNPGGPIFTGEGLVSDAVRSGLELERGGMLPKVAAKKVGLSAASYMPIRKLVLLADRDDLSVVERRLVEEAIANIDKTRRLRKFLGDVKPVIDRVWGKGAHFIRLAGPHHHRSGDARRKEAFHTAIVVITDTCVGSADIEIPPLTPDEKAVAMRRLQSAKKSISELSRKIWRTEK